MQACVRLRMQSRGMATTEVKPNMVLRQSTAGLGPRLLNKSRCIRSRSDLCIVWYLISLFFSAKTLSRMAASRCCLNTPRGTNSHTSSCSAMPARFASTAQPCSACGQLRILVAEARSHCTSLIRSRGSIFARQWLHTECDVGNLSHLVMHERQCRRPQHGVWTASTTNPEQIRQTSDNLISVSSSASLQLRLAVADDGGETDSRLCRALISRRKRWLQWCNVLRFCCLRRGLKYVGGGGEGDGKGGG
jgi:hypothetical protein